MNQETFIWVVLVLMSFQVTAQLSFLIGEPP